ncbi:ureidoglycolate hydrolase [Dimargaris cristalligena]|uniref:Ureidoglycolate hydrolase n=1 Tax=Dimargaris cristalligena TaxID=215637 RepID=A0A4P9ZR31_9FUNG|nr:ureidoglycolate hydrolase [Dimargaris cristalligena]|eukprot:RKP35795.1 ureidoglycolate hydrolase [Dimargaris cristalligena]
MEEAIRLPAQHLTPAAYAPFGRVIDASALTQTPEAGISANQNTARRLNAVSPLTNLRPEGKTEREPAQPNLCLFRCSPRAERPFPVRLLERHPFSTQMFMPIAGPSPKGTPDYLVIVAENGTDDRPNLNSLKAFVARPWQGITYHPGIWHHPMVALHQTTDFLSLVWENSHDNEDCNVVQLPADLIIQVDLSDFSR